MKLLIIEDNHDVAGILGDFFEAQDAEIDFATNGELGLSLALADDFDAIILDLMLPKMDGLTLCKALREQGCSTPVLMLTALDNKADLMTGFDSGADDYLGKPFDLDELDVRIKALIKRHRGNVAQAKLRFGDLEVDTARHQVTRQGMILPLTPTTYQILHLLIKNAPNVVTREQLIDELWGQHPPGKDILRSHVYQLRNQLDKPFGQPMLVTVPKVGLRLDQGSTDTNLTE
ncbi:two-component system response regulator [Shewanella sp. UCD-FRSSP16_17]|uniref:response regulator transcription factor n=1 Tax=unclassified Shewanella TaxID=196818 RepID=UPI0007EEE1D6|nr:MULTISPECIES: response regulator transcription factor [unclassified Shewanella]MBQ4891516.1 response regulator transcription factor [Shewanella sp. MMG014]OBT07169.1 two-component system response regulator [Shewanella sp. UCD-FRSSP16_17]